MNITINGNNNTVINLENATTFGELRDMLPSTGVGRVPGIEQLKKKAEVLLQRDTPSGIVTIFNNGFFTFEECGHVTVWGVDRCEWSELYSETGRTRAKEKKKENFSAYPWDMILETAGSARLSHNADSREEYQAELSLDAPESADKIAFSTRLENEVREDEEEMAAYRITRNQAIAEAYENLREDQKQLVNLYFIKKMRQEDIAKELGIDRTGVTHRIATIKKRFEKFL